MFVLNFVLFFNLFTLVIFMKVDNLFHHIVDACVEFCFLKKQFLNLTINMQLLYFITTVTSQVHSATISMRGTVLYRASSFLLYLIHVVCQSFIIYLTIMLYFVI